MAKSEGNLLRDTGNAGMSPHDVAEATGALLSTPVNMRASSRDGFMLVSC